MARRLKWMTCHALQSMSYCTSTPIPVSQAVHAKGTEAAKKRLTKRYGSKAARLAGSIDPGHL
eukprot:1157960-Pelagomonas_calceolata.AAC.3